MKALINQGHQVNCLNRRGKSEYGTSLSCDRRHHEQLKQTLEVLEPEVVIDMIPFIQADAEGVCQALKEQTQVQIIAVSSIDVYQAYGRLHRTELGPYQTCPIRETDALREQPSIRNDTYDKISVENTYLKHFENVAILRLPAIYGWPDRRRVDEYIRLEQESERVLRLHPDYAHWRFSRASAPDCAHGITLTAGLMGHHIYNVSEETALSTEAWCQAVWHAADIQAEILYDSKAEIPFNIDTQQHWYVDSTKIRTELGYEETTDQHAVLRENIRRIREAA